MHLGGANGQMAMMGSSGVLATMAPVPCGSASCANGLNNLRIRNDLSAHGKSNLERAKLGACSLDHDDPGEGSYCHVLS